jgi:tRNA A37 threonylcarbamoyladenosine dehydratase
VGGPNLGEQMAAGLRILRWRSVAQVARALMELGREMRVTFVDPETVEAKNVPRQNFCDAEIGLPKAEALARRYATAWGLEIEVIVRAFEPKMIGAQIPPPS